MTQYNDSNYDVIIAGAGPVGLFLSCELALAGCSVLILEKTEIAKSPLKQMPFGMRGLSVPTIESLYRRGLLFELEMYKRIKNPHTMAASTPRPVGHFAGIPLLEANIDKMQWKYQLPGYPSHTILSEMEELETILNRRAENLKVAIRRGSPVTDFHQTANGVSVQSGSLSFDCKWLVGCDGSRSVVRKIGGFDFAGTEPEFTGYSMQVDIPDPGKLKAGRNVMERGMYLQSQPGYVIMQDFDKGAFHQSEKPLTLEHVQEVLRRITNTDVTIHALHVATTWTDRARQATSYRKDRILLAGDAAHIHAPLGGQGLNLGLGDAMNLGWKLAATIHTKAPEHLLDSYFTERYPIGKQVLDWSRAQVAIMGPEPHARALHAIMRDLIDTRDGATYIAGRVWGIQTAYDLGGTHPLVGRSVPNFELEDGITIGERMSDGKGILLDFHASDFLDKLTNEYGDRLKYVSARAKEQFGLRALLIRPDGFVAWVTEGEPDLQEIQMHVSRWFGKRVAIR